MRRGETGRYDVTAVGGESARAFIPAPLPPAPPLVFGDGLERALEPAVLAVGLDARGRPAGWKGE